MSAADRFREADARAVAEANAAEEDLLDTDSLYDHERLAINRLMTTLMDNIGSHRELSAFQREVRERFAEIGFVVRVDFYEDPREEHLSGAQIPQITLVSRCDPLKVGEFDHDRMGHEVRSNILGVRGQDNTQKTQVAPGWASTKSGIVVPGGTS